MIEDSQEERDNSEATCCEVVSVSAVVERDSSEVELPGFGIIDDVACTGIIRIPGFPYGSHVDDVAVSFLELAVLVG